MTDKICNNFIDNHYLSKFQSKVKSVTKKEKPLKIQKIRYKFNLLTPKKTVCDYLNKHITNIHENKKPFKCENCPMYFGQMVQLHRHVTTVHENHNQN